MSNGNIRVGIGGWSYAPWRGVFYPAGLPQAREFDHAVNHVTAIEINATFYGRQKPASWAKWAAAAPDGFRFAVKGSRYCVTRPQLADAGDGVERFFEQGMVELGDKLGPILWQFAPNRRFDEADIAAFLALLPQTLGSLPLRHVIEPRHASFEDPAFAALCRKHNAAIAYADDEVHPCIDVATADFAYARLQRQREEIDTGYDADQLDGWAKAARGWALDQNGGAGRDVYVFMINGAKVRAPAAAQALIARLDA